MMLKIFCVKDRATDTYGNPMFLVSRGQVIRSFTDEINRKADDNQMYVHPEDFDLFECGEFNTDTGEFAAKRPEQIAVGKDLRIA